MTDIGPETTLLVMQVMAETEELINREFEDRIDTQALYLEMEALIRRNCFLAGFEVEYIHWTKTRGEWGMKYHADIKVQLKSPVDDCPTCRQVRLASSVKDALCSECALKRTSVDGRE